MAPQHWVRVLLFSGFAWRLPGALARLTVRLRGPLCVPVTPRGLRRRHIPVHDLSHHLGPRPWTRLCLWPRIPNWPGSPGRPSGRTRAGAHDMLREGACAIAARPVRASERVQVPRVVTRARVATCAGCTGCKSLVFLRRDWDSTLGLARALPAHLREEDSITYIPRGAPPRATETGGSERERG